MRTSRTSSSSSQPRTSVSPSTPHISTSSQHHATSPHSFPLSSPSKTRRRQKRRSRRTKWLPYSKHEKGIQAKAPPNSFPPPPPSKMRRRKKEGVGKKIMTSRLWTKKGQPGQSFESTRASAKAHGCEGKSRFIRPLPPPILALYSPDLTSHPQLPRWRPVLDDIALDTRGCLSPEAEGTHLTQSRCCSSLDVDMVETRRSIRAVNTTAFHIYVYLSNRSIV